MALTLFLFKVSNLQLSKPKSKPDLLDDEDQSLYDIPLPESSLDENITLLSAKVTFRGIYQ